MSEVKTIRLYGQLGAKFGRVHRMAVNSAAEAVSALSSQIRGFESYLTKAKDNGMAFTVFLGKRNINEDGLRDPAGADEIRIAPVMMGAKRAGIFQIILGAVLIVVGAFIGVGSGGTLGAVAAALIGMGTSMIVGGVVQLLAPSPKKTGGDSPDANASYLFNGPVNTQAQGNPVPLLYGRLKVGSSVISAGIRTDQQQAARPPRPVFGGGSLGDWLGYMIVARRYDQEYPSAD